MEHSLARLFNPRGVAIIGASQTPGKYGTILMKSLVEGGYTGGVYPVSPSGGRLLGHPFLASLGDAQGEVDVALIVRPAPEVPSAMRDVVRHRVPFAIVYAAGFSEHGSDGERLESEMVAVAREGGTRVVGPNCMNIFSAPARLNLSSIPFRAGNVALLSASGNLGFALAQEAAHSRAIGFSRFISAGNQADLALDEYLDYLALDAETRLVLVYAEGFARGRGRLFLESVGRAAAAKPVLVLRGGRTRRGSSTAASHTGALTGEADVLEEALGQAGAVSLDRSDEILDMAQAVVASPPPRGRRVVLVGEGGGHATLLTDAVVEAGLDPETLPPELQDAVRRELPPFAGIVHNPVEFAGKSEYDPGIYERVLRPILAWPGCDQVILFGGYAVYEESLAALLLDQREDRGTPILIHDLHAHEDRPSLEAIRDKGLPLFSSVEVAAHAAATLARAGEGRGRARRAQAWSGEPQELALSPETLGALREARGRETAALTEHEASALLSAAGVNVLPSALVGDEDAAVLESDALGYPVVLKVHSSDIPHKSDRAGVHLELRTPAQVRRAFQAVAALVPSRPEARLTPYRRGGIEVIAGARRDGVFGPILLFGAGGLFAELIQDQAIRTIPCPEDDILEMVEKPRVRRLLGGVRGRPSADIRGVVAVLQALARIILARPEISDVEINPLLCAPDGCVALDARVLVAR